MVKNKDKKIPYFYTLISIAILILMAFWILVIGRIPIIGTILIFPFIIQGDILYIIGILIGKIFKFDFVILISQKLFQKLFIYPSNAELVSPAGLAFFFNSFWACLGVAFYFVKESIELLIKITKIVKVKSKIANKEETKEEIPYINKDAKTEIELQQETDRKLSTVEPFIDLLKNGDEHDKKIAAEVIREMGVQCAVEPLIEVLREVLNNPEKEEGYETGTCAARALGKIGDSRAVEPLIDALRDKGMTMRLNAAIALGEIGDKRAVEPLIEALQDKSIIGVDQAAAEALGKIGDSRAVEPLKKAFIDYSFKVEAIDKITKKMKRKQEP